MEIVLSDGVREVLLECSMRISQHTSDDVEKQYSETGKSDSQIGPQRRISKQASVEEGKST